MSGWPAGIEVLWDALANHDVDADVRIGVARVLARGSRLDDAPARVASVAEAIGDAELAKAVRRVAVGQPDEAVEALCSETARAYSWRP